jgi:hypothetical protein
VEKSEIKPENVKNSLIKCENFSHFKKFPYISWNLNVKTFQSMKLNPFYIPGLNPEFFRSFGTVYYKITEI